MSEPGKTASLEGPGAGYNGLKAPTAKELTAPRKDYADGDIAKGASGKTVEGPGCEGSKLYHK